MRVSGPNGDPYIIIAPNSDVLSETAIARLVAMAMLDSEVRVLLPTLMPFRHANAFVKTDGRILRQVFRKLPEWALNECNRIADLLLASYKQFIDDFIRAFLGNSTTTAFNSPPPDIPLITSPDAAFTFEPPPIEIDPSGFEHQYSGIPQHMIVRMDYGRDRYMAHLSDSRIIQRANDIMRNVHQIDSVGRITVDNKDPRLYYWMDRFSEVLHEAGLRNISRDTFGEGAVKDYPYPRDGVRPARIAQSLAEIRVPSGDYLVRYDKFDHILEAYETGRIRLGPAASYSDPSLDVARRDDELNFQIDIDTSFFPVIGPGACNIGPRFPIRGSLSTNYYILCTSSCLRVRLFLDFDSEAGLVIRDPEKFKDRLSKAIARDLPQFSLTAKRVEYYDPLWVAPVEVKPIFSKHFRYAYQEEVRFAVMPPGPTSDLAPVFLNLGSLKDIATIVDTR